MYCKITLLFKSQEGDHVRSLVDSSALGRSRRRLAVTSGARAAARAVATSVDEQYGSKTKRTYDLNSLHCINGISRVSFAG